MGKFILLTSIKFISGRPSLPITALWVTRSLLTWGINCPSSTKEFQQQSQGPQKGWLLSAAVCRGEPQPGPVPWLLLCVVGQTHMSLSGQARADSLGKGQVRGSLILIIIVVLNWALSGASRRTNLPWATLPGANSCQKTLFLGSCGGLKSSTMIREGVGLSSRQNKG